MRTRPTERPGGAKIESRRRKSGGSSEILYGRNAVRESLLANRRRHQRLLVGDGLEQHARIQEITQIAVDRGIEVKRTPRHDLDTLVSGNHQGVALVTSTYPYAEVLNLAELAANHRALLALDGLADPQNVGTLLRTAEITGIAGVIIPTDRAASITPAVVNASAGAVEHLNILQEVNLSRWLMRAKEAGFWVVGLAGDDEASSLFEVSMQPPVVIVTGSEGAGIRRLVRETCDIVAAIPMAGQIASLNAAVAGSIALYEVFRDRDSDSDAVVVT